MEIKAINVADQDKRTWLKDHGTHQKTKLEKTQVLHKLMILNNSLFSYFISKSIQQHQP